MVAISHSSAIVPRRFWKNIVEIKWDNSGEGQKHISNTKDTVSTSAIPSSSQLIPSLDLRHTSSGLLETMILEANVELLWKDFIYSNIYSSTRKPCSLFVVRIAATHRC